MSILYVITKRGFDHNNEVYFRHDADGGIPVKAYTTKEIAHREADKFNVQFLKDCVSDKEFQLNDFGYCLDDIFKGNADEYVNNFFDTIKEIYDIRFDLDDESIQEFSNWFNENISNFTDEELLEFVNATIIMCYEVVEIELDD